MSITSLSGFLLCAGKGTRFDPHTRFFPKVLLPFLNLPLVSYNLYLLKTLGVKKISVNTHLYSNPLTYKLTQQAEVAGIQKLVFSHEKKLLGSAGGLYQLKNFFEKEEHFFYLNGDSFIWPEEKNVLDSFYQSHIESKALASFLVKPTTQTTGVIWADETQGGRIYSFLKEPFEGSLTKPYDFSGLALFSNRVFQVMDSRAVHIFKDVLENISADLRVHSIPGLKLLDMNQLNTYLKGVKEVLCLLQKESKSLYIRSILNLFSPDWCRFSGENYFSATPLNNIRKQNQGFLFCGKQVKGLENLFIRNFAVLGDHCSLKSSVYMDRVVLGEKVYSRQQSAKCLDSLEVL